MLNNQSLNLPVSRFFSTCQVFTAKKAPEKPTEVSARLLPGAVAAVADGSTNTYGFTLGNHHPLSQLKLNLG
jgi:hypothetical protein